MNPSAHILFTASRWVLGLFMLTLGVLKVTMPPLADSVIGSFASFLGIPIEWLAWSLMCLEVFVGWVVILGAKGQWIRIILYSLALCSLGIHAYVLSSSTPKSCGCAGGLGAKQGGLLAGVFGCLVAAYCRSNGGYLGRHHES